MADLSDLPAREARPRVVAVGGPTATGKTALALALARRFDGEIIGADSMQIYRGLDIGTAKPTAAERAAVPHHLVDFLPPEQPYSVADYTAAAAACIAAITAAGRLPLVVGGTGLYITSLLNGVVFAPERPDPERRAALLQRAQREGAQSLYGELCAVDPAGAAALHPNDLPRVVRALELYYGSGRTLREQKAASRPAAAPYRALCLCLTFRDRAALYRRIDARVDAMLAAGLLDEARRVWQRRADYRTAAQAIGYKELFPFLAGEDTLEACVARLKQATRRYAKRQLTWFRHQSDAVWLYVDEPGWQQQAVDITGDFLQRP